MIKGLFAIAFLALLAFGQYSYAETDDLKKKVVRPKEFSIQSYEESSFSPSRSESFELSVSIPKPKKTKKVTVDIYTSDNDLIRTLELNTFERKKYHYVVAWDGKDENGVVVPDEAYIPVVTQTLKSDKTVIIDRRKDSGGEEVYDFEKNIRSGSIEYSLPENSRVLVRTGVQNGAMLKTVIDWEPRTKGFHAERWNGRDADNLIDIENHPRVGYLIVGFKLPDYAIITYGNKNLSYRNYREKHQLPIKKAALSNGFLERDGKVLRSEYFTPVLHQKTPRIQVKLLDKKTRKEIESIQGHDEVITEVKIDPLDELYLDQERYEISFFIDDQFIAEEEQGFVPFTWRWSPGRYGIEPGEHILTVNVSGYKGQVGVKNIKFQTTK